MNPCTILSAGFQSNNATVFIWNPPADAELTISPTTETIDWRCTATQPHITQCFLTAKIDATENHSSVAVSVQGAKSCGAVRLPLHEATAAGRHADRTVSVLASACAATGSASPVFSRILADSIATPTDAFVMLGDAFYEDIAVADESLYYAAWQRVFASRPQHDLFTSLPYLYIWDDHDFGPNDSDGSSPSAAAAHAVVRAGIPMWPLASSDPRGGIYRRGRLGRVLVLITDCRSQASPDDNTLLGAEQLSWLLAQLTAAGTTERAYTDAVLWVTSVPFVGDDSSQRDQWSAYPDERRTIASHAAAVLGSNITLVILHADAHALSFDDGRNARPYANTSADWKVLVAGAGPLARRPSAKGGPYSHGCVLTEGQFARLTFADGCVRFVGMDVTGETVLAYDSCNASAVVYGGACDTGLFLYPREWIVAGVVVATAFAVLVGLVVAVARRCRRARHGT